MTFLILTICLAFGEHDTCEIQHHDVTAMSRAQCALEVVGYHRARIELERLGQLPTTARIGLPVVHAECSRDDAYQGPCEEGA